MRPALAFALLALAGCEEAAVIETHNPSICSALEERSLAMPDDFDSQLATMHQCFENWSARLSRSPDPADVVVQAVMGACADTIPALARYAEAEGREAEMAGLADEMKRNSLFRVVQWRAGNCRLPDEGAE